jgi:hypothetical protein
MHLKMSPVSSDSVPPKSDKTVTQSITIDNPNQVNLITRVKKRKEVSY